MLNLIFYSLLHNHYLQVSIISWAIAQLLKVMIALIKTNSLQLERLFGSGGFPSSHTALVFSLTTYIGLKDGLTSSTFAIVLILSLIVMYDASGVRRAAGKQAGILNELIKHLATLQIQINKDGKLLKELLGHTPFEVFGGVVLGFAVAITVYTYYPQGVF